MAYAITIDGRLYGYGETQQSALAYFYHQIAGASYGMRGAMKRRAETVYLNDDEASEVAEMIAAPAIRWE